MTFELDKATRIALDAQVKVPWQDKLREQLAALPTGLRIMAWLFMVVAVGALIAATYWEANNAGGGFQMLGKGVAEPWLAYTAGFGFTIAYIVFHRFTAEALRQHTAWPPSPEVLKPAGAATVFALLSLAGVFANLVDNASANKSLGEEQAGRRAEMMAEVMALRAQVNAFSEPQMRALLESSQRLMLGYQAEAAGWGMSDLEPDGACMADLKPRQRQLCNLALDTEGTILQAQAAIEANETTKAALKLAEQALAAAPEVERQQFWGTASKIVTEAQGRDESQARSSEAFLALFMLFVSLFTLFGTGLGWDAIFEYLERRGAANKEAP